MSKLIPPKNVLLLVGVLALGGAARYYGDLSYSSAASFMSRSRNDMNDAETWLVICLLALAGSLAGAALGYRLNRVTAAVLGLVGGAVATARYNSIVGGFIAIPMSLLVACLGPRRMAVGTLAGVVAAIIGVCDGYAAGAISVGPVEPVALLATMLLVVMVVAAGNVGLAKWRPAAAEENRWRRIAGRSVLAAVALVAASGSFPLGITLESLVWLRSTGGDYSRLLRPLDAASFTRGFCNLLSWEPADRFHESDLRKLRRFDAINYLQLGGKEIGDESLTLIGAWPALWYLDLSKTRVTDQGMRELAGARFLQRLDLSGTRVTGGSFSQLPRGLVLLRLNDTAVTDASLAKLATLPLSWQLALENTTIGDAGVANLRGLARLNYLDLSGTRITDAALATVVKNHARLQRLDLRNTKITPAGLAHLAKLPKLGALELCDCSIGDDAIDELVRCKWLVTLNLSGTKITPQGVARLREALPDCNIECELPDR